MKRYNNLYESVTSYDNIYNAYLSSRQGKEHYDEVRKFDFDPEGNCKLIQDMLVNKTFTTSEYKVKRKNDRGKERTLYILPYFPDRVIQHAVMNVIEDILKRTFIRDTFQSIKGRGVHDCKRRVEKGIISCREEWGWVYYAKVDINSYYPSIDKEILKRIVRKKIKCRGVLWLLDDIIDSSPEGIPIGSYLSQYLGNLYLTYLDHFMKEVVGCRHYFRYCDDIVILSEDKGFLHKAVEQLGKKLEELNLTMKNNNTVSPITDEVFLDFVGYKFYLTYTHTRKGIVKRFINCPEDKQTVLSYYGWVKHCSGKSLWAKHGTTKLKSITIKERRSTNGYRKTERAT